MRGRLRKVVGLDSTHTASGRSRVAALSATSSSSGLRSSTGSSVTVSAEAAARASLNSRAFTGLAGFQMIATRAARGTASLRISSRLAASSTANRVIPVTLPGGRDKFGTRPVPTGSPTPTNTMGIVLVAWAAARAGGGPAAKITSRLVPHQIGGKLGEPVVVALGIAGIDHVVARTIAQVAQTVLERCQERRSRRRRAPVEVADPYYPRPRLRLGGERRGEETASDHAEE